MTFNAVNVLSVSIQEIDPSIQLRVFPNPTSSAFTVQSNKMFGSLKVYDIFGHLLANPRFAPTQQFQLMVENYPNGIYFVQADNSGFERVVVAH